MNTAAVGAARIHTLVFSPTLPRRRPAAVFCAKPRRRRNRDREPQPYEYQEEAEAAVGAVGLAALSALLSEAPQNQSESPTSRPLDPDNIAEVGGGPLRGSDILQALQRAAANKGKAKAKAKKRPPVRRGEQPLDGDFESVRAIEIKSEWVRRIEELERRVHLLQDRQHL